MVRKATEKVQVFPMYVGVILRRSCSSTLADSIPHVCGGDPKGGELDGVYIEYSPCMWG